MSVIFRMRLQIMNMARTSAWREAVLIGKSGPKPRGMTAGHRPKSLRTLTVTLARKSACSVLVGMSQEKLGQACGITFQQIQKYEKGTNRMGASRLHQIARVLQVPVEFFYEGAS